MSGEIQRCLSRTSIMSDSTPEEKAFCESRINNIREIVNKMKYTQVL